MWPFSKKTNLELAPVPGSDDEEITLLPEDVPEALPALIGAETKVQMPSRIEMPQRELVKPMPSVRMEKKQAVVGEKFLKMDKYKSVFSEFNNINVNLDNIEFDVSKVIEIKNTRSEKIDNLQSSLEDISKKLIFIENSLFGG